MTVKDLVSLLKTVDQNALVLISSTPQINGWVSDPLSKLGKGPGGEVVLGASDSSSFDEEIHVDWK
jgi:hypothetical protein